MVLCVSAGTVGDSRPGRWNALVGVRGPGCRCSSRRVCAFSKIGVECLHQVGSQNLNMRDSAAGDSDSFSSVLAAARVLPVITTAEVDVTLELISTLHRAGMRAIEVTLRSTTALECIAEARSRFPELLVAAGTVVDARTLEQAQGAGAQFVVSPGISAALLEAARESDAVILPGVASASDIMLGMDYGLSNFKFFPAVPAGGIAMLKAFAGPFPAARFCPTGGLGENNFRDYLALPNVICCGGSWMVAGHLVENETWDEIERLAAESMT